MKIVCSLQLTYNKFIVNPLLVMTQKIEFHYESLILLL